MKHFILAIAIAFILIFGLGEFPVLSMLVQAASWGLVAGRIGDWLATKILDKEA